MDKFIPIGKQSKKAQREYYSKRRNTWGSLNPVTRTVPNGKGYDRNKLKQEDIKNGRFSHNYEMRKSAIFYGESLPLGQRKVRKYVLPKRLL